MQCRRRKHLIRFLFKSSQLRRRRGVQFSAEKENLWWDVCGDTSADQWRTKQVWWMGVSTDLHRQDPFSVDCRKEAAKKDKTWEGVTFLWKLLPLFPNGGKNMEYWLKPVSEKQGWSWVNPITMDCKMKEYYSAPPQKSLLWAKWGYLTISPWLKTYFKLLQKIKRSLHVDSNLVFLKSSPSNDEVGQVQLQMWCKLDLEAENQQKWNVFAIILTHMKLLQQPVIEIRYMWFACNCYFCQMSFLVETFTYPPISHYMPYIPLLTL